MPDRTDPVEIKITLSGDVEAAIAELGLEEGLARDIWFLEDDTPGLGTRVPLLDAGIVLRLRSDADGGNDSTVKLRPCRRSQLAPKWPTTAERKAIDFKVEADWSGSTRALAASCSRKFEPGRIDAAVQARGDLTRAFVGEQIHFLQSCGAIPVSVGALRPFGPIVATKWSGRPLGRFEIDAERWAFGSADLLELSIRVRSGAEAESAQPTFEAAVRARGLAFPIAQDAKTRQALMYLTGAA